MGGRGQRNPRDMKMEWRLGGGEGRAGWKDQRGEWETPSTKTKYA